MSGEIWGGKEAIQQRTTTSARPPRAGELAADIISGSESYPATALLPCGHGCCGSAGEVMVIGLGILGNVEAEFECGGRWTFVHPLFSVCAFPCPLPTMKRCVHSYNGSIVFAGGILEDGIPFQLRQSVGDSKDSQNIAQSCLETRSLGPGRCGIEVLSRTTRRTDGRTRLERSRAIPCPLLGQVRKCR